MFSKPGESTTREYLSGTAHWLRMQAAYDLAQLRMRADPIDVKRLEPKAA